MTFVMNSGKRVPVSTDEKIIPENHCYTKRKSRKIQIIVSFFIATLNVFLFCVTILTLSRVRNLENEVDLLKSTFKDIKLKDEGLFKAVVGFENSNFFEEDAEKQTQRSSLDMLYGDYFDDTENNRIKSENTIDNSLAKKIAVETSRTKRNAIAATKDGIVINSESYAQRKALNNSRSRYHQFRDYTITPVSAKPSSFGSPPVDSAHDYSSEDFTTAYRSAFNSKSVRRTPPPVYTRHSRVMHHENKSKTFRQPARKLYLKSGDTYSQETTSPDFTVVRESHTNRRRYRQRNLSIENLSENPVRMGRIKLPAIHYSGDTSKYVLGQHENFNGNGHLRHAQRTFVDWKVSDWATTAGMSSYFTIHEGVLTVKESGLYLIYAQIYYLDQHDINGFRVHKNRDTILQCTITIHGRERRNKGNTCYTAGVEYLSEGDSISLADISDDRYSVFEPGKSFFGLVKISDIKIK